MRALFTVALAVAVGLAVGQCTIDRDAAAQWVRANQAEHALGECRLRHGQLVTQIKREGLWVRLGMPGQPWLQ